MKANKLNKLGRWFFLIIASLLVFFSFLVQRDQLLGEEPAGKGRLPSRAEIQSQFHRHRKVLLIYPGGDAPLAEKYRSAAENYRKRARWIQIEISSDQDVRQTDLSSSTLLIWGTPRSNKILAKIISQLPVAFGAGRFQIFQKKYDQKNDLFTLFYPNPANPQLGLYLLSGNDDAYLARVLHENPPVLWRMKGDYQVLRGGESLALGFFSQEPDSRWQFSSKLHRDFESERQVVRQADHLRLITHNCSFSKARLDELIKQVKQQQQRVVEFIGQPGPPSLEYHVYSGFEDKGLMTGDTRFSHIEVEANKVHAVIHPDFPGDEEVSVGRLVLQRSMGRPASAVMETGLAVYLSKHWRGKGYRYWASRLYLSGGMFPLRELFDEQIVTRESNLLLEPQAGALVEFLIHFLGKEKFLRRYRSWRPSAEEISELEKHWKAYWHTQSSGYLEAIQKDRAAFPKPTGFLKGFCHAHEGYQVYNGYLSAKSDQALAKLKTLGVNSVSLTPFSYMRDVHTPVFLRYSRSAGSENDESIIYATESAHHLGLSVMLKPHLWMGNSWPGEIEMYSSQDWQKFFHYYKRWIRHYALLAEMYNIEILCVGVEMVKTTLNRPDDWRQLIGELRELYSGQLTYAANWGEEFEKLPFWETLDYIGLNCYYPLSQSETATDADLLEGAKKIMQRIATISERYQKPLVITEVGFTSTPAAWIQPHEHAAGKSVDLQAQARAYRAFLNAATEEPHLQGIYWWKWPTYLEYGGSEDNDFTPNNKPAEAIVSHFYLNWPLSTSFSR